MARAFYSENPETLTVTTSVVARRPGRVALATDPFFPGGGGQLPDRGLLRWSGGEIGLLGFETDEAGTWLVLDGGGAEPSGQVEAVVDPGFRTMMRELHTATHVLNALVFRDFDGALVTGAQLSADGTARLDFDLPEADNDRLRALEAEINDVVRQDLAVSDGYIAIERARAVPGLIRSKSVSPPAGADGMVRVVEIAGLDRQACGGTHLASTGRSPPVRILKIENKGRHNRRVRIGVGAHAP